MEVQTAYSYEPLEHPDNSIRLIKILSISPQICCQLRVVSIESPPEFTTLSYVWGDATIKETITIDGKVLPVTQNLAGALRDVFNQWNQSDADTTFESWLWADGICINQEDSLEKNHQVPLMEQIYSNCSKMFSWLGFEDGPAQGILDSIELVSDEVSQLPGYDYIIARTEEDIFPTEVDWKALESEIGQQTLHGLTDLGWVKKYYSTDPESINEGEIFTRIGNLFNLLYWRRLWIFQETVLAQNVVFLSAAKAVSWNTTCCVFLWMLLVRMRYSSTALPDYIPHKDRATLASWATPSRAGRIAGCKELRSGKHEVAHLPSDIDMPFPRPEQKVFMYKLGAFAITYQATNPKDYVYGMCGVSGIRIKPDYRPETTVAQVYQDHVAQYLEDVAKEDIRRFVREQLSLLWFLDLAGIGFMWETPPGLPSWAPNFSGAAATRYHPEKSTYGQDGFFIHTKNDTSLYTGEWPEAQLLPKLDGPALRCMAIIIDKVAHTSPTFLTGQYIWNNDAESQDWLLWLFDCAARAGANDQGTAAYDTFIEMANSIITLGGPRSEPEFGAALTRMVDDMRYVCKTRRGLSRAAFDDVFFQDLSQVLTDQFREAENVPWSSVAHELVDGIDEPIRPGAVDYTVYHSVLKAVNKLSMAFTVLGRSGVFPPLVQVGDLVCVLQDYAIPVVLRKSGDGYGYVGPCYIAELEEGEADGMMEAGIVGMEEIRIC
jgi:hypothetical protein